MMSREERQERDEQVSIIDRKLVEASGWLFERLSIAESDTDRAYYQGRIDAMAEARKIVYREENK